MQTPFVSHCSTLRSPVPIPGWRIVSDASPPDAYWNWRPRIATVHGTRRNRPLVVLCLRASNAGAIRPKDGDVFDAVQDRSALQTRADLTRRGLPGGDARASSHSQEPGGSKRDAWPPASGFTGTANTEARGEADVALTLRPDGPTSSVRRLASRRPKLGSRAAGLTTDDINNGGANLQRRDTSVPGSAGLGDDSGVDSGPERTRWHSGPQSAVMPVAEALEQSQPHRQRRSHPTHASPPPPPPLPNGPPAGSVMSGWGLAGGQPRMNAVYRLIRKKELQHQHQRHGRKHRLRSEPLFGPGGDGGSGHNAGGGNPTSHLGPSGRQQQGQQHPSQPATLQHQPQHPQQQQQLGREPSTEELHQRVRSGGLREPGALPAQRPGADGGSRPQPWSPTGHAAVDRVVRIREIQMRRRGRLPYEGEPGVGLGSAGTTDRGIAGWEQKRVEAEAESGKMGTDGQREVRWSSPMAAAEMGRSASGDSSPGLIEVSYGAPPSESYDATDSFGLNHGGDGDGSQLGAGGRCDVGDGSGSDSGGASSGTSSGLLREALISDLSLMNPVYRMIRKHELLQRRQYPSGSSAGSSVAPGDPWVGEDFADVMLGGLVLPLGRQPALGPMGPGQGPRRHGGAAAATDRTPGFYGLDGDTGTIAGGAGPSTADDDLGQSPHVTSEGAVGAAPPKVAAAGQHEDLRPAPRQMGLGLNPVLRLIRKKQLQQRLRQRGHLAAGPPPYVLPPGSPGAEHSTAAEDTPGGASARRGSSMGSGQQSGDDFQASGANAGGEEGGGSGGGAADWMIGPADAVGGRAVMNPVYRLIRKTLLQSRRAKKTSAEAVAAPTPSNAADVAAAPESSADSAVLYGTQPSRTSSVAGRAAWKPPSAPFFDLGPFATPNLGHLDDALDPMALRPYGNSGSVGSGAAEELLIEITPRRGRSEGSARSGSVSAIGLGDDMAGSGQPAQDLARFPASPLPPPRYPPQPSPPSRPDATSPPPPPPPPLPLFSAGLADSLVGERPHMNQVYRLIRKKELQLRHRAPRQALAPLAKEPPPPPPPLPSRVQPLFPYAPVRVPDGTDAVRAQPGSQMLNGVGWSWSASPSTSKAAEATAAGGAGGDGAAEADTGPPALVHPRDGSRAVSPNLQAPAAHAEDNDEKGTRDADTLLREGLQGQAALSGGGAAGVRRRGRASKRTAGEEGTDQAALPEGGVAGRRRRGRPSKRAAPAVVPAQLAVQVEAGDAVAAAKGVPIRGRGRPAAEVVMTPRRRRIEELKASLRTKLLATAVPGNGITTPPQVTSAGASSGLANEGVVGGAADPDGQLQPMASTAAPVLTEMAQQQGLIATSARTRDEGTPGVAGGPVVAPSSPPQQQQRNPVLTARPQLWQQRHHRLGTGADATAAGSTSPRSSGLGQFLEETNPGAASAGVGMSEVSGHGAGGRAGTNADRSSSGSKTGGKGAGGAAAKDESRGGGGGGGGATRRGRLRRYSGIAELWREAGIRVGPPEPLLEQQLARAGLPPALAIRLAAATSDLAVMRRWRPSEVVARLRAVQAVLGDDDGDAGPMATEPPGITIAAGGDEAAAARKKTGAEAAAAAGMKVTSAAVLPAVVSAVVKQPNLLVRRPWALECNLRALGEALQLDRPGVLSLARKWPSLLELRASSLPGRLRALADVLVMGRLPAACAPALDEHIAGASGAAATAATTAGAGNDGNRGSGSDDDGLEPDDEDDLQVDWEEAPAEAPAVADEDLEAAAAVVRRYPPALALTAAAVADRVVALADAISARSALLPSVGNVDDRDNHSGGGALGRSGDNGSIGPDEEHLGAASCYAGHGRASLPAGRARAAALLRAQPGLLGCSPELLAAKWRALDAAVAAAEAAVRQVTPGMPVAAAAPCGAALARGGAGWWRQQLMSGPAAAAARCLAASRTGLMRLEFLAAAAEAVAGTEGRQAGDVVVAGIKELRAPGMVEVADVAMVAMGASTGGAAGGVSGSCTLASSRLGEAGGAEALPAQEAAELVDGDGPRAEAGRVVEAKAREAAASALTRRSVTTIVAMSSKAFSEQFPEFQDWCRARLADSDSSRSGSRDMAALATGGCDNSGRRGRRKRETSLVTAC